MPSCSLCAAKVTPGHGHRLTGFRQKRVLAFLKGRERSEGDEQEVCERCYKRIRVVAEVQRQVGDDRFDASNNGGQNHSKDHDNLFDDDDDEHSNFDGGALADEEAEAGHSAEEEADGSPSAEGQRQLQCQLCPNWVWSVDSLRRHYKEKHQYDSQLALIPDDPEEQGDENRDTNGVTADTYDRMTCKKCSRTFLNKHTFIKHALDVHVADEVEGQSARLFADKDGTQGAGKGKDLNKALGVEAFKVQTVKESNTRKSQLGLLEKGLKQKCQICNSSVLGSRMKGHESFVHKCRFCKHISENRVKKLEHLQKHHAHELTAVCEDCGKRFETAKNLLKHKDRMHNVNLIPCPGRDCSQVFVKGSVRLDKHLLKYHSAESEAARAVYKFECEHCGKKLKTASILRSHLKMKHNVGGQRAKCPHCSYSVPMRRRSDIYRYHMKRVHPERVDDIESEKERIKLRKEDHQLRAKIQCFLCPYAATKASNITRHYVDIHGYDKERGERKSKEIDPENPDGALCPECGEHFPNKHLQIRHLIKVHSKSQGEACLYCNFRYLDIEEHIKSRHEAEMMAEIQYCKKCTPEQKFTSFQDLLRHARSYHRKKPEKQKPVSKKTNSDNKSSSPSNKNRLCENCGKKVAAHILARHLQECEDMPKRYVPVHLAGTCPFCELKFSDLLGHVRNGHKKEKMDPNLATTCPLCNETFSSTRQLVTHRQLHPQFRMHRCMKCKAEFEMVVDLRTHRTQTCPKRKRNSNKPSKDKQVTNDTVKALQSNTSSSAPTAPSATSSTGLMALSVPTILPSDTAVPPKPVDFEGRGTVSCHLCSRSFTMKVLLRRHYQSHHHYRPELANTHIGDAGTDRQNDATERCTTCNTSCPNRHAWIKHQLDYHSVLSGQVCPYCDSKWGPKKFDNLDEHVDKYHFWDTQSPIQECASCKAQFANYQELKMHRQIHDKKQIELISGNGVDSNTSYGSVRNVVVVHSRVGAIADISNRGGVKCALCNAFKLRKDHLKTHYVKHHGYNPKLATDNVSTNSCDSSFPCPSCRNAFNDNNSLIKHLLKQHCQYSGLICPYCRGHHPERYIDLQTHVMQKHMDQLTGYNINNSCKVCKKQFVGYAELRDHVQAHGNAFREPYGNPEAYRDYARNRKRTNSRMVPIKSAGLRELEPADDDGLQEEENDLHNESISSDLIKEILDQTEDPPATLNEENLFEDLMAEHVDH